MCLTTCVTDHKPSKFVKTKGRTPRLCVLILRTSSGGLLTYILNGDQGRKFCSSWFKLFPDWLEYSPTTNAAYCLPCFLYAKPSGCQRENAFTIEGFRSWNKKYCIIVDETKDVSKREQMTVVLRFVDKNGYIQECLFVLIHVKETNALYLKAAHLAEIKRLLELEELETGKGKNQIGTVKRAGDTRWGSHFGSLNSLLNMYNVSCSVLQTVIKERKGAQRGESDKAYDDMTSFEFVLVLHIMIQILGITNDLCQALFNDEMIELLSLSSSLDPKRKFQNFKADDIYKLVSKFYPADFTEQEKLNLKSQLDLFLLEIKEHPQLDSLKCISDLCRWLAETEKGEIYYLIDRLVRLVLTLPVSTATAERAFSAMKLIKTALRNRMEDDYLTDSLNVYVEKGIAKEFNIDSIIDEFASKNDRRSLLKISKTNK
ncbi:hypothetical protein RND81_14G077000 [Saponaria officinalis]|uniref:TTF-type domain-containing protein n=1 Tax=Saponaria officinalis TaxID=3572 RepID=A0AAW1GMN4_SAPOF